MEGVNCVDDKLVLSNTIINKLPDLLFKWVKVEKENRKIIKNK